MKDKEALDCFEKLILEIIAQENISFAFKDADTLNDEDGAYIPTTRSIYILDCYNDPTIDNRKNKRMRQFSPVPKAWIFQGSKWSHVSELLASGS